MDILKEISSYKDQSATFHMMTAIFKAMLDSRGIIMDIPELEQTLWKELQETYAESGVVMTEKIRELTPEEHFVLMADIALRLDREIVTEEARKKGENNFLHIEGGSQISLTGAVCSAILEQFIGHITVEAVRCKGNIPDGIPMCWFEEGKFYIAAFMPSSVYAAKNAQDVLKGGISYVYPQMSKYVN